MAVFFTSLLPQFGAESFAALLALGLVFCSMTFVWLSAYAAVVARVGDVLRRQAVRRAFDAVVGAVLVAVGLRIAVDRR
jgi:threonine/homoserine/homoserine lactone efflux protein